MGGQVYDKQNRQHVSAKNNKLFNKTLSLIKQLSAISSTYDNHEKTVRAISLFESIAVPENSTKAKGMTYLKKGVGKLFSDQASKDMYNNLGLTHYKIRDKYLHTNIPWPLNKNELINFWHFYGTSFFR